MKRSQYTSHTQIPVQVKTGNSEQTGRAAHTYSENKHSDSCANSSHGCADQTKARDTNTQNSHSYRMRSRRPAHNLGCARHFTPASGTTHIYNSSYTSSTNVKYNNDITKCTQIFINERYTIPSTPLPFLKHQYADSDIYINSTKPLCPIERVAPDTHGHSCTALIDSKTECTYHSFW